ncbi:MAG TPA: hypothetical protein VFD36_20705 [Kofleriaceae bacterium]|nr:hypothetical protein [Kofleriaceae bacterium]
MKRTFPSGGGVLCCDVKKCTATFISYSIVSLLRPQAKIAKWGRRPASLFDKPGEQRGKLYDTCPEHDAAAALADAQRKEARAEQKLQKAAADVAKEERKAARAKLAQERREEKARKRAERDAKKALVLAAQNDPERARLRELAQAADLGAT